MNANSYLSSLGIEVTAAAKPAIGKLALSGEFVVGGERGVLLDFRSEILLRSRSGDVSDHEFRLLASEGYSFVVVNNRRYPSFYARKQQEFVPVRALPIVERSHFPSTEVLRAWFELIRVAAPSCNAVSLGVAQLVARLDDEQLFGPELVCPDGDGAVSRLGGTDSVGAEPFRTAAALLAGFRLRPNSSDELARLVAAIFRTGRSSRLLQSMAAMVRAHQLGSRLLVAFDGTETEIDELVGDLIGAQGTVFLPAQLQPLTPLLERLLPGVECAHGGFLESNLHGAYGGAIVVPPSGVIKASGAHLGQFESAMRGSNVRNRVRAEWLFIEHALSAIADGAPLITIVPEDLLSANIWYSDFRSWLIERAQLLAVVSLPSNFFRRGKWSIVILRKLRPADDYPILMVDVDAHDFSGDIEAAMMQLNGFLERQVAACL